MQGPDPNFTFITLIINRKKTEPGGITGFIFEMVKLCPSTKMLSEWNEDAEVYGIDCIFDTKEFEKIEKFVEDNYSDTIEIRHMII